VVIFSTSPYTNSKGSRKHVRDKYWNNNRLQVMRIVAVNHIYGSFFKDIAKGQ